MTMYYGALPSRVAQEQRPPLRLAFQGDLLVLCAWCLHEQDIAFPKSATSTICEYHAKKTLDEHRAKRVAAAADALGLPSEPVAPAQTSSADLSAER